MSTSLGHRRFFSGGVAAMVPLLASAVIALGADGAAEPTPAAAAPAPAADAPAPARPDAPARPNSEFRVAAHGFAFRNSFSGSPLPTSVRRSDSAVVRSMQKAVEANVELPKNFGLCGGMSLAAADFFYAGMAMPGLGTPPEAGTPLYEYLYQRQMDSWGAGGLYALRFLQWMRLPDAGAEGTIEKSRPEVARIVAQVRGGRLLPVGLVLTRWGAGAKQEGRPWENHQVLCWKADEREGGVDLHVYDPNFPRNEGVILRVTNCTLEGAKVDEAKAVTISRLAGTGKATAVRGVFAMPYEFKRPPEALAEAKDAAPGAAAGR